MIINGNYKYKIDNKIIYAWWTTQADDEPPCLMQDINVSTGLAFSSDSEAEEWMQEFIRIASLPPIDPPIETPVETV